LAIPQAGSKCNTNPSFYLLVNPYYSIVHAVLETLEARRSQVKIKLATKDKNNNPVREALWLRRLSTHEALPTGEPTETVAEMEVC
jgi:hypothetical protein